MKSLRLFNRQAAYVIAACLLVFAVAVQGIIPAVVSAAQVTDRSIALSSSSISATSVTYTVNFTSVGAAGAFVLDFCSDSPVIGATCTPPTDFDASGAASTTSGFTGVTGSTSKIVVDGTIASATNISVEITGIDNPSASGPLYARIVTYDTLGHANSYASTALGSGSVDSGSVAISITNTIGVTGAVLESMTFCVSGSAISADCAATTSPVLELGETVGAVKALIPSAISTGTIYTQISSNAAKGAVISLKSSAIGCGGLKRLGAPSACDILPALTGGISAGQAKFGIKTGTVTNTGSSPNGTLQPVTGSGYNSTTYALNYVSGDGTGVTSAIGDPFLDTDDAPINNKNMPLTFGASVTNSTPAGTYSADLGLIATGKF